MLYMVMLGTILLWSAPGIALYATQRGQAYQISPKPCFVDGIEGTCMFVWECIKSEGYHIGMCVDTFMFGSCCAHNITANTVLPQQHVNKQPSILYTPPSHHSHVTKRPLQLGRPITSRPKGTSRPFISQTPIVTRSPARPHVAAAPVARPSPATRPVTSAHLILRPVNTNPAYAGNVLPVYTKPSWQTVTEPVFATSMNPNSIESASRPYPQWQVSTEPMFVTKLKLKPKPSKKPVLLTTVKSTVKFSPKTSTAAPAATTTTPRNSIISSTPVPLNDRIPVDGVLVASEMAPASTTTTSSASPVNSEGCGLPTMFSHAQTRIVGGRDAQFGRWPWQVSVRRTSFFGFSSTHRCGGAILNENWIATAGHCVDDLLTSQIRIRVGEYDFSNVQEELPYVERSVARKIVHPKYNFFTYEYDLALVQLDKSLDFEAHISPICLPASDDLLVGQNATVTGWGRLSEGGSLPTVLQEVQVPIVSNDNCKSMFLKAGRQEYIPDIFLCAGYEKGGQDSCQGDSGGPLQVRGKDGRYFLAGIISWGIGCAEANLPGVCTRISKFVPWILKNVT